MVFTRPLISKSSYPCTKLLMSVRIAPITIDISVIFIIFFSSGSFSHQYELVAFRWSLSERKSPRVSCTLLRILVDLNSGMILIDSLWSLISSVSSSRSLGIVSRKPTIIAIIITFMSLTFFSSQARSWYLFTFSFSFILTQWFDGESTRWQILIFKLILQPLNNH